MTVEELIEELKKHDPQKLVIADCGDESLSVYAVIENEQENTVIVKCV